MYIWRGRYRVDQGIHKQNKTSSRSSKSRLTNGVCREEQCQRTREENQHHDCRQQTKPLLARFNIGVVLLGKIREHDVLKTKLWKNS